MERVNKKNYAIYYCVFLWVLAISFPNVCGADYFSDRRDALTGGIRDPIGTVTDETIRIGAQLSTYLRQGLIPPVVREYITYLENQGNGRWKALPNRLRHILAPHYVKALLSKVRYAENINTVHGQGITIGNNIYFPQRINLKDENDFKWLLHELEHVSQYYVHGGINSFLIKYFVNGGLEIGRNGSFDPHDAINLERDADNKAERIFQQVWDQWTAPPIRHPKHGSLVCIESDVNGTISYRFRWGNNRFQTNTITRGSGKRHWWPYRSPNENQAPPFIVEFDRDSRPGWQNHGYNLRTWPNIDNNCNRPGIKEVFRSRDGGRTIDIFSIRR